MIFVIPRVKNKHDIHYHLSHLSYREAERKLHWRIATLDVTCFM